MMLAGLAMLCAHAMFKAALFMVVGVIDHATGTRDIRRLAWLGTRSRPLLIIAVGATASMAALPPFLGFVAKEADFETVAAQPDRSAPRRLRARGHRARLGLHHHLQPAIPARGVRPQGMTGGQHAGRRNAPARTRLPAPAGDSGRGRPGVRALAAGLDSILDSYADTVPGGERTTTSRCGTGSACRCCCRSLVLAIGTAAFLGRRRLRGMRTGPRAAGQRRPHLRRASCEALDVLSVRLTAVTQRGSIPATQAVILTTLVLVPWWCWRSAPATGPSSSCGTRRCRWWSGLMILAAALGATVMRNRLAAVLLVGVTGYGCGAIFAFHGAPDLALTQFLVETLTAGDLRAGAAHAARRGRPHRHQAVPHCRASSWRWRSGRRSPRLAVFAMAARTTPPIADLLPDAAYLARPRREHRQRAARRHPGLGHHGRDLGAARRRDRRGVNGVPHRRFGSAPRVCRCRPARIGPLPRRQHSPAVGDVTWLRGSELRDPRHRSLVLEVATRLIFPLIMVLSAYFFFAGHNTPGGGFAGGLTAGLALVLRYLAGGRYELGETLPLDAGKILGAGLICRRAPRWPRCWWARRRCRRR